MIAIISENWDIRDGNLKKQAHLLRKAELKRRGITRYDAEILLAQGLELPEPKVVLERKIPSNITKNQTINLNEFEGRQRLSPRKHLSSQSLLSSAAQMPLKTRTSQKKHLKNLSGSFNQGIPTSPVENNKVAEISTLNGVSKHVTESFDSKNTGFRHRPRGRSKSGEGSVQAKTKESVNTSAQFKQERNDEGEVVESLNQKPASENHRNIFSRLQFEVDDMQGLSLEKTEQLDTADSKRKLNIHSCKHDGNRKNLTPEMPRLTPFDSETFGNEGKGQSSSLESEVGNVDGTGKTDYDHYGIPSLEPSLCVKTENKLSSNMTSENNSGASKRVLKSPRLDSSHLRKSPRKRFCRSVVQKLDDSVVTEVSSEHGLSMSISPRPGLRSASGLSSDLISPAASLTETKLGVKTATSSKLKGHTKVLACSSANSVTESKQLVGPTFRTRSHSKDVPVSNSALSNSGVKICDTNVFETFNRVACAPGDVDTRDSFEDFDEQEDIDVGCYREGNIFEALSKKLSLSEGKVSKQNGHFGKKYSRKRRLSFGGSVQSPTLHLSRRKKKFSLEGKTSKKDTSSRNIFDDLSPQKIPKITIKMPKDPVLVKELANQHSESVHFKLESPQPSLTVTPDNSDSSDSDEEESPLNCTKFRPAEKRGHSLSPGAFSMKTSQFYSKSNSCPKLMRIKLGDTHILDINIPQCK